MSLRREIYEIFHPSLANCLELIHKAKYTSAIECLLKLCDNLKNPVLKGEVLRYVAHCQFELGKLEDAESSTESAISLLEAKVPREKLPYREKRLAQSALLQSYRLYGVILRKQGNSDKAVEYYQKVVDFCEETDTHRRVLAECYYNLANLYQFEFHDDEKGLKLYRKSRENYRRSGITTERIVSGSFPRAYHNARIIYHKRKDFQKCLEFSLLDLFYGAYMKMTGKVEEAKGLVILYYNNLSNLNEYEKIAKAFCYAVDDLSTAIPDRKKPYELVKLADDILPPNPSVENNTYMKLARNVIRGNYVDAKKLLSRHKNVKRNGAFRESGKIAELIDELSQERVHRLRDALMEHATEIIIAVISSIVVALILMLLP